MAVFCKYAMAMEMKYQGKIIEPHEMFDMYINIGESKTTSVTIRNLESDVTFSEFSLSTDLPKDAYKAKFPNKLGPHETGTITLTIHGKKLWKAAQKGCSLETSLEYVAERKVRRR